MAGSSRPTTALLCSRSGGVPVAGLGGVRAHHGVGGVVFLHRGGTFRCSKRAAKALQGREASCAQLVPMALENGGRVASPASALVGCVSAVEAIGDSGKGGNNNRRGVSGYLL